MRSEKDKMLSGGLYNPLDPQLSGERRDARLLVKRLNDTRDDQVEERKRLIEKLLPSAGEGVWIERPFSATHPLRAADRRAKREFGAGSKSAMVWIGGGVIICAGVRVGAQSAVGAGSVVTKDIPEDVVAAGNPCRVLRKIAG